MQRKIYEPGIYDISSEEYHGSAGISRSGIMEFRKSARHFWYRYLFIDNSTKQPTKEMIMGSAFHCYVLENNKFDNLYYISQQNPFHGNSKEGRHFKFELLEKSAGKIILSSEEYEQIQAMALSITNDSASNDLIQGCEVEKSIYWIDPDTQILCKCRPDAMFNNYVVDLKTTANASERAFQSDFYKYGYHIQVAMIQEGLKHALGKEVTNFIDLAVEKTEPYCMAIYSIDEAAIEHGKKEFKHQLMKMKHCFDNNDWPGYGIKNLMLPAYATIEE